ncbi:hypothetical protein ONZ51_g3627 [Trametes cubensis]|uniref:Uncharacterized protein n=1 Tax=Trametes cubensis TaxID=1111947 RepID=A0AAD7XDS3_9APHY|nr:hypothetical protein ONZ51_g3627 [Trametes cubensis]
MQLNRSIKSEVDYTRERNSTPKGKRAILPRRKTISSLPEYRPSPLSNEVLQQSPDRHRNFTPTQRTARDSVTIGGSSTRTRSYPESEYGDVLHRDKENVRQSPQSTPALESGTNQQEIAPTLDIPLHDLRQYVSAYRRLLPTEVMKEHKSPDSPLMTQRLSTRPLEDEIHEELLENRKRKWNFANEDGEDKPSPKRICLASNDETPAEGPSQGAFTPRPSYNPPSNLRRFRIPQWGSTKEVKTAADVLRVHSLAVKRVMPRKGTEGWLEYEQSSADVLTTQQDICWRFEAMEIDDIPDASSEENKIEAGDRDESKTMVAPGIGGRLIDLPEVPENLSNDAAPVASPNETCAGERTNSSVPPANAKDYQDSVGVSFDKRNDLDRPFYFGIPWEESLLLGPADRSADLLLTPPPTPWFESALFRID